MFERSQGMFRPIAAEPVGSQAERRTLVRMRFFDSWWEHLPTLRHVSPVVIVTLALLVLRPLGYYWE
jgi:hypothetical protein